ncbi:MAG: amidohydrolase [Candidatus Hodarchaeota archaeon]
MDKEKAWKWIIQNEKRFIEISDKIWELAELGLEEFKSSALLADVLEEYGFDVQRGIAGMPTAFLATFGEGTPVLGVMGEYDALPGLSQEAVPYKKPLKEGAPGHGCGHNIHGVSGMAGVLAVKEWMKHTNTKGTLKFFGAPAEETYDAKVFIVREGHFDDVQAVLSHHPYEMNVGNLYSTLAMNMVKFHFYGVASHAAYAPEQGRSALDAVELMNVAVNFMREHIIPEARIHYVVEEGGEQPNVVPSYARSWYYIRAPERDQVNHLNDWILKIAEGADLMARTTHAVEFLTGCHNMIPNQGLSLLVGENMRKIGAPKYTAKEQAFAREISKTITKEEKMSALRVTKRPGWQDLMDVILDQSIPDAWDEGHVLAGSTDVSDVSWKTPTLEFTTATWVLGTAPHSWQAVAQCGMGIGHKSLIFAAQTIAGCLIDLFTKPERLKTIQDEFLQRTKDRIYQSPIPEDVKSPLEIVEKSPSFIRR